VMGGSSTNHSSYLQAELAAKQAKQKNAQQ